MQAEVVLERPADGDGPVTGVLVVTGVWPQPATSDRGGAGAGAGVAVTTAVPRPMAEPAVAFQGSFGELDVSAVSAPAAAAAAGVGVDVGAGSSAAERVDRAPVYRALVMGNSAYRCGVLGPLSTCVWDAEDMGRLLERRGYVVSRVVDGEKCEMEAALEKVALDAGRGDTVLVFYSGHGLALGRANYLVPVDGVAGA